MTKIASICAAVIAGMVASGSEVNGQNDCTCIATCSLYGDPHYDSYFGAEGKIANEGQVLMYSEAGFEVTATTFGSSDLYVKQVTFGNLATYTTSECSNGTKWTNSKTFSSSSSLDITVQCSLKNNAFHLDTTLNKIDNGSDSDFAITERSLQTSGICMQGDPDQRRRLRSLSGVIYGSCTCQANCSVLGDPHLTDFDGKQSTISGSSETYYSLGSFKITGVVDSSKRITSFTFGDVTHQSSECTTDHIGNMQTFGVYNQAFSTSSVQLTAQCHLVNGLYYWNLYISKTDKSTATVDTFNSLEASYGASGLCLTA